MSFKILSIVKFLLFVAFLSFFTSCAKSAYVYSELPSFNHLNYNSSKDLKINVNDMRIYLKEDLSPEFKNSKLYERIQAEIKLLEQALQEASLAVLRKENNNIYDDKKYYLVRNLSIDIKEKALANSNNFKKDLLSSHLNIDVSFGIFILQDRIKQARKQNLVTSSLKDLLIEYEKENKYEEKDSKYSQKRELKQGELVEDALLEASKEIDKFFTSFYENTQTKLQAF